MDSGEGSLLAGAEIHGFQTAADLDVDKLMTDALTRWFRPNEVYAILSNYTRFKIQPQPLDTPPSGSVLLFDRKMLRNFRKDGHNWKKKKDGKTVQEAHEKLKIGNEERIHVYYARSEDDPNFYRRCYWLLDKNLERIVLVHYRQTSEEGCVQSLPLPIELTEAQPFKDTNYHDSPSTPLNSTFGSAESETSASAVISEEINSDTELQNHELSLHEINTLEWEDLVGSPTGNESSVYRDGDVISYGQQMHNGLKNSLNNDSILLSDVGVAGVSFQHPRNDIPGNDLNGMCQTDGGYTQTATFQGSSSPFMDVISNTQAGGLKLNDEDGNGISNGFTDNMLLSQISLDRWNDMNENSLGLLDNLQLQTQSLNADKQNALPTMDNSSKGPFFSISDISPGWAYSTEETKVLVVGSFSELYKHPVPSSLYCIIGETCVPVEMFQPGVYRFIALPQPPGIVNLFMTLDGQTPISQVLSFDYRCSPNTKSDDRATSLEDDSSKAKWKNYKIQKRLTYLLFKTTNVVTNLSVKISPKALREAKRFMQLTSAFTEKNWTNMLKQCSTNEMSSISSGQDFLELVLRSKLQEWLLEKIMEGCRTPPRDYEGQGIIHLCVMLEYTWAVRLYSLSGLSLDFRDINGWTALHWAAYLGREKMVAALLSAGANPSLVADPTPEYPGGCTAADLAYTEGYHGLSGYLAEKGLNAHFEAMSLSGNVSVSQKSNISNTEDVYSQNLSEQELCLKDSLAAYRNAADAADRIQAAIRERALKIQTKAVQLVKPEIEASQIVAALKIQHAFRSYNRRKLMKAAARIQSHFRTWKTRKNFLNMRRQVIRIQAVFRGHQIRKQYKKIVWSVGVLEKAILRWRLKRKGLRGIQVEPTEAMSVDVVTEITGEEEFYRISREQAEDRVKRSVVRVQSMFRSYRAQQEYRRMKLAYDQAKLEFSGDLDEE